MPVLTSPDVLPEAMRYITKVLLAQGGTAPKSELHRLISPSGLQGAFKGSERFEPGNAAANCRDTQTLTAMASIGLVAYGRGEDADVTLVEEFADRLPKWDRLDGAAFASFFANEAIDDRNLETEGEDKRDADGSERGDGAADLVHALAMLMWMPDPLDPLGFEAGADRKSLQDFQMKTLGPDSDDWLLRNRERFPNFVRWATYLGFARLDQRVISLQMHHEEWRRSSQRLSGMEGRLSSALIASERFFPSPTAGQSVLRCVSWCSRSTHQQTYRPGSRWPGCSAKAKA